MKHAPLFVLPESAKAPWYQRLWVWGRGQPGAVQLVLCGAALLTVVVGLDAPLRSWARALDPSLNTLLSTFTALGNSGWAIVTFGLFAALCGWAAGRTKGPRQATLWQARRMGLYVLTTVLVSGGAALVLKNLIGRARPLVPDPGTVLAFRPLAIEANWASFPSGHATTAIALAVALMLVLPRLGPAFLAIGVWVALSRALIGAHWLSDVLAGAVLGASVAVVLHKLFALAPAKQSPRILRVAGLAVLASLRALPKALRA